jgi:3D (Asp-Asp-Asp) domain-containing protein
MKGKVLSFLSVVFSCLVFWAVLCFGYSCSHEKPVEEAKDVGIVFLEDKDFAPKEEDKIVVEPVSLEVEQQKDGEEQKTEEFVLTAYCSCRKCCGKHALNRPKDENGKEIVYGASGAALEQGVSVAVDPSVIPYGSIVCIDGKEYIAQDCGSAIKGNRIDVYFESHEDAKGFGKQKAFVEVLEK